MFDAKMMNKKVSFFVDREEELQKLHENTLSLLKGNPKHNILQGYRRMGKTHLIVKHLLDEWNKKIIPIYLDMLYFTSWVEVSDAIVNSFIKNYDEVNKRNLIGLLESVKYSVRGIVESINEIEATFGAVGKEFISLRLSLTKKTDEMKLLRSAIRFVSSFCDKNDINCVLCFDEIQNISEFDKKNKGLAVLRGELQFQDRINLIVAGSLPSFIKKQFLMKNKPFWKQSSVLTLKPFDESIVKDVLRKMRISTKHSKDIFILSKGIPDYVVKIAYRMKTKKNVEEAFLSIVEDEDDFVEALLSGLSNTEMKILKGIAFGKDRYSNLESILGYPPTAVLRSLGYEGVIKKIEKGKYIIIDPILEHSIRSSKVLTE